MRYGPVMWVLEEYSVSAIWHVAVIIVDGSPMDCDKVQRLAGSLARLPLAICVAGSCMGSCAGAV
jgi:hypothetical protein